MTETPNQSSIDPGTDSLDWADPSDLPTEEVRDVFLTLSKALRAYQLYDPNNPVYKRFVANLRESLTRILETRDRVQLLVEEDRFTWMGEEVYRNTSRADSLAFMFYRDGIRDITLRTGLEGPGLESLLDVLHRVRNVRGENEDLVTMLWELDPECFGYSAVEVGGDPGDAPFPAPGRPEDLDPRDILQSELGPAATEEDEVDGDQEEETATSAARPAESVRTEDFNPTLYALDEHERQYVQVEIRKEMERDLRTDVLRALFDRLEEPERPDRQLEILGILRILVPNFLSRGILISAAQVVDEIRRIRERPGVLGGGAEALAEELVDDLSAPEAVEELIRALEDGSVAPDAGELSDLLRYLRPVSLATLLRGSEETQDDTVREVLREAIQSIAEGHRGVVIRLLESEDPAVASGAVRLAGRLRIAEAGDSLVRLLDRGPRQVRKVVVETASEVPSSVLVGALRKLLRDEDRELRVASARVLGEARYAPAAEDFRTILQEKEFRETDVTEKVAFFEAYGTLAGDDATSFLSKLLNSRGFLGRREPPDVRAGAALALGKVGSPSAQEALAKAARDDEPVVRSAVARALKDGGGSHV
ncbi:MAG: HEAT repeat domain-containing protein [Gemmatimonadota bacterium]